MMQSKVHQITDGIHGTIYISELEYLMMSTPFFYRLHDVYQSSTVYMTFPSNRTKRYEHSLGTMELAGKMFYSAITNAKKEDKTIFLESLLKEFSTLLKTFTERTKLTTVRLYETSADNLSKLLTKTMCQINNFSPLLTETMRSGYLYDPALCKQEVCFFDLTNDDKFQEKVPLYSFLYQCSLEALRIAALFHDIGHPPFSHIIEHTLKRLYENIDSPEFSPEKVEEFKNALKKYIDCNSIEPLLLQGETSKKDPALHEQIGLDILYNTFRSVMKSLVSEWSENATNKSNKMRTIYLITVIEFTFGILLEKSPVFEALHRLIDGPIDADRLDYIVRDSKNSGVDWGTVPYERLISALKFVYSDQTFVIAFPEKVTDDLDDLIVNRYKIFQRINYHHKSVKTSELMQRAVEFLAKDYLVSQKGDEIIPEIKDLWCSLESAFGQNEVENKISKWTDSWLTSVLSNALIRLSDGDIRYNLINTNISRTDEYLENIYMMLEEVLLSKKRFFPLLKRQRDAMALKDAIKTKASINNTSLQTLLTHEYDKLIKETGERSASAKESLYRINILQEHIFNDANLGLLDYFFYGKDTCNNLIKTTLEQAKSNGIISNYFMCSNQGFNKLGVSETTKIYLYRSNGNVYLYDVSTILKRKLLSQRSGCLWLYVYVSFSNISESEIENKLSYLSNEISTAIGDSLYEAIETLFGFSTITSKKQTKIPYVSVN